LKDIDFVGTVEGRDIPKGKSMWWSRTAFPGTWSLKPWKGPRRHGQNAQSGDLASLIAQDGIFPYEIGDQRFANGSIMPNMAEPRSWSHGVCIISHGKVHGQGHKKCDPHGGLVA